MYITKNFKETQKLGEKFVNKIANGGIIALYGNLGSGKTTFVQGLAKGLGIKGKIISPTFIIVRKYEISTSNQPASIENFYHIDLYRIESEKELIGLGLNEILNDPSNIIAIEWPEKIEKILPESTYKIHLEYQKNDTRQIRLSN